MNNLLAGKRVLVTGATSGIGRAIALAMAAEGARVAVHGRSAGKATPVVEEICAQGGDAFAVGAELTDYTALEAMCVEALRRLGGIDVAVNNAGIFAEGRIRDVALADWERNFAVHVTAPMLVTRHVVPAMIEQGEGGSLFYLGSTSSTEAGCGVGRLHRLQARGDRPHAGGRRRLRPVSHPFERDRPVLGGYPHGAGATSRRRRAGPGRTTTCSIAKGWAPGC